MSQFVHLPRRVLCPEGHVVPYPRVRSWDDGSESVVGTCVPCGRFYDGLGDGSVTFEDGSVLPARGTFR